MKTLGVFIKREDIDKFCCKEGIEFNLNSNLLNYVLLRISQDFNDHFGVIDVVDFLRPILSIPEDAEREIDMACGQLRANKIPYRRVFKDSEVYSGE